MTQAVIELRDVVRDLGGHRALDGVSLTVRQGEFLGLVGPNGAGKTTCLRVMQGLLRPSSGTACLFGDPAWPPSPRRNVRMAAQPQQVALFERLTVREQVRMFAALRGVSARVADESAERLALGGVMGTRQEKLSGGERQRLSVACALVGAPELLFLDEPTANVDPVARRQMRRLFRELAREGTTIVYTSHDLNEVAGLCDVVTVLVDGAVLVSDSPDGISRAGGLQTVEVTTSQVVRLLDARLENVVSSEVTDTGVCLVVRADAGVVERVLEMDPHARVVQRVEPFEETYIRLVTGARGSA